MKPLKIKTKTKSLLADTHTPVSLYLKIRDKYPNSLLLESSIHNSKTNSYTFVCLDPLMSIMVDDGTMRVSCQHQQVEEPVVHGNFYALFEKYLNLVDVDASDIHFNGFYGYTCFDAIKYFENIKLKSPKTPSSIPDLQYSFFRFIIGINHYNNDMTILENVPVGEESKMTELETIIHSQSFAGYNFEMIDQEQSNMTDHDFVEMVQQAKAHCKRGDVFQMVLSRQFRQSFKGDEFNVYRTLRSINPSPYLFFFDYGNFKLMGSSPEAQIKIEHQVATINPIAGTFKRTGDATKDHELALKLAADPKENAEHIMLVDLARNDLSKHAQNVVVDTYKEVQYFSHVIHLVSTVIGEINGKSIEILGDTFPAGTLSGAPKYKAIQLIDKYENQTRGFYGGCVGFMGLNGDLNQAIAIRSFVSKRNVLYSQAGAGIVIDSVAEKELQEVNNKLEALKKAIIFAENI